MTTPYPPLESLEVPDAKRDQPYDAAMRRWAEHNLPTLAGWLDPTVAGLAPTAYARQATAFTVPTIYADLLISAGKNRLMHVEYETSPRKDLATRMYNYRGRIMSLHPKAHLTQHVLVLGAGWVRGHDDLRNGFILDVRVTYLREQDPADFLSDPVLAPLAVLARGTRKQRERYFAAALRLIRDSAHPWASELIQTAETLAHIRLDPNTIGRIRKENGMSIKPLVEHYRNTEVGHHLQRIGREEEKQEVLLALLHRRFGNQPEASSAILQHLAGWTVTDAMDAILDAPNIETLLTAKPPA